ncbi:MAG: peptidase C69, partial [Bacteroidaceae bacterium]|nr:peptidase C69 [Bacteroidaceae bacterium]
ETAQGMHSRWRELGEWLIVKYNDMVIHPDKDGKFLRSQYGLGATPVRPGYSDNFKRHIKNYTNGRYEMPAKK